MHRTPTALTLAAALLTGLPAPRSATAQQQPAASSSQTASPAGGTLSVKARLVTLPVTVRDKKGKIVTGLTAADFTLTESGRLQTIKSFSTDTNLPLTLGLLVDTSGSMRDLLDRERTASQAFFQSMLTRADDKAFLLHFDREVELLEDLTSSKEKLNHALDELGPTRAEADDSSSTDSSGNNGSNGNGRPMRRLGGTTLYDAIYLASDDLLRKQTGRKAIVLLSDGQDRGSKETLHSAIEAAQRSETSVYTIYFKGEEHPYNNYGNNPGMGRRGGMGYPGGGYPGGGYPGGGYPRGGGYPGGGGGGQESHIDGKKIMEQIAGDTGGRFFEAKKKENLDDIYAAISEELRTQYVLAYTPDAKSTEDSGFHPIQLTTSKKDVFIQTRPGYYSGD